MVCGLPVEVCCRQWTSITLLRKEEYIFSKMCVRMCKVSQVLHYLGLRNSSWAKCFQGLFFVLCSSKKNTLLSPFAYKVKEETTQFTLIACSLSPGLMQTSGAPPPPFHSLAASAELSIALLSIYCKHLLHSHALVVLLGFNILLENVNNAYMGVDYFVL